MTMDDLRWPQTILEDHHLEWPKTTSDKVSKFKVQGSQFKPTAFNSSPPFSIHAQLLQFKPWNPLVSIPNLRPSSFNFSLETHQFRRLPGQRCMLGQKCMSGKKWMSGQKWMFGQKWMLGHKWMSGHKWTSGQVGSRFKVQGSKFKDQSSRFKN